MLRIVRPQQRIHRIPTRGIETREALASGASLEDADYFVDWANGNDTTGNGSELTPWKTLAKAIPLVPATKTLAVCGHDLEGEAYIKDGTRLSPADGVTIRARYGHSPVIVNSVRKMAGDFSKTLGQTNVYEAALGAVTLYGGAPVWHGYSSPTRLTLAADLAACDAATNSYFYSNPTLYVNVGGGAPDSVFACTDVADSFRPTSEGVTFDGLTWKMGAMCIWARNVAPTPDNTTIQNCVHKYGSIYTASFHIAAGAATLSNITMQECVAATTQKGIFIDAAAGAVSISGVTAIDCATSTIYAQGGDLTISDVSLTRCGVPNGSSLYMNTGTSSWTLSDFITLDPVDNAMEFKLAGTAHHGVVVWTGDVSYGVHDYGIVLHHAAGTLNLYNITVYNGLAPAGGGGNGGGFYFGTDAAVKMRNCGAVLCKYGVYVPPANTPTLDLDYLGLYDNTANYGNVDAGDQAAHAVTSDPLFVDASNEDFDLQAGSPWRGAGEAIAGISETNPAGIGRYEYAS